MTAITPSRGRARLGILVPFTNVNLEADMAMLRPEGVSLHFQRLGGYDIDEIPERITNRLAPLAEGLRDQVGKAIFVVNIVGACR